MEGWRRYGGKAGRGHELGRRRRGGEEGQARWVEGSRWDLGCLLSSVPMEPGRIYTGACRR